MSRHWWTLAGSCCGLFVLMLDSTVVALALPSIRHDVDASAEALQWMMNGYLLTIAVLVVTAGRLGDMFGRRRVFVIGGVIFALGSVLSGAAGDQQTLIVGRVLQGVGAAPMLPLSLALVVHAFKPEDLPRALGIWTAVSAIALAIGPLVGGLLIELDWRVIFWMNLPIIGLGIVITDWATPESTDPESSRHIDWPGLAALTAGLTAVILALIQTEAWGDGVEAPLILGGVAALVVFWFVEHHSPDPIVDFKLFRNGPYFGASATAFCLVGGYWVVMFFQPQLLQDVRDHSPVAAGLLILPVTVPMVLISPFSGRLIARFGVRALMTTGMVFATIGLAVLTQIGADTAYVFSLVGYGLFGIALGFVYAPMSTAAMEAMPAAKVGIASGVLAMDRVLAGAVALAATGAVFNALLGDGTSFAGAIGESTWVVVALSAVGSVLSWAFVRDPA